MPVWQSVEICTQQTVVRVHLCSVLCCHLHLPCPYKRTQNDEIRRYGAIPQSRVGLIDHGQHNQRTEAEQLHNWQAAPQTGCRWSYAPKLALAVQDQRRHVLVRCAVTAPWVRPPVKGNRVVVKHLRADPYRYRKRYAQSGERAWQRLPYICSEERSHKERPARKSAQHRRSRLNRVHDTAKLCLGRLGRPQQLVEAVAKLRHKRAPPILACISAAGPEAVTLAQAVQSLQWALTALIHCNTYSSPLGWEGALCGTADQTGFGRCPARCPPAPACKDQPFVSVLTLDRKRAT